MPITTLEPASLRRDDPFVAAVVRYFEGFGCYSPAPSRPIDGYLAGGIGVRCYAGSRVTSDVDMFFRGGRVLIPPNATILVTAHREDHLLVFDHQYTPDFGMLHPDHHERAVALSELASDRLRLLVLHPVDLAITKVVRLEDHDRADIASLALTRSFDADAFLELGREALGYMVGNLAFAEANLRDAALIIEQAQERRS